MTLGWISLVDAVAKIAREHNLDNGEAAKQIVTAARNGSLYTQGRLYNDKGLPFAINPGAWDGMDPYPAMNMLCTPNPGTVVQEPFLRAPNVHKVEIHGGSFDAWAAGQTRPPIPDLQPASDSLRNNPLVWGDLYPQPRTHGEVASADNGPEENGDITGPAPHRKGFSKKALEDWYKDRVKTWPTSNRQPSEADDWAAAKQEVSAGITRDAIRKVRVKHAPAEWRAHGRRPVNSPAETRGN
jgi:hypothetical protein